MTGPEQYAEAEVCIERARANIEIGDREEATVWAGLAQVHATLALVAAHANTRAIAQTPLAKQPDPLNEDQGITWAEVIR